MVGRAGPAWGLESDPADGLVPPVRAGGALPPRLKRRPRLRQMTGDNRPCTAFPGPAFGAEAIRPSSDLGNGTPPPRAARRIGPGWSAWSLVACSLLFACAAARAETICLREVEPNDQIDQAATLIGAACFEGDIDRGAQDRFFWTIPASEGAHGWTTGYEGGYPGARLALRMVKPADATGPASEGQELSFLDVPEGAYGARSPEILMRPGTYLVDVLANGPSPYRVRLEAIAPEAVEAEPNNAPEQANALTKDRILSGSLQADADVYAITLTEADVRRHWGVEISGAIGAYIAAELLDARGNGLVWVGQTISAPMEISSLGLAAGTYFLRLAPSSDEANPYTVRLTQGGPRLPSREDEPNDSPATAFPLETGIRLVGELGRNGDADNYVFNVTDAMVGRLVDVKLRSASARSLCLSDAAAVELQCRNDVDAALSQLSLPAGRYFVTVSGAADPQVQYELSLRLSGRARVGTEIEPNDRMAQATPIAPGQRLDARLLSGDADHFRLGIEGPPQLWSIRASGPEIEAVSVTDFAGTQLGSGTRIAGTDGAGADKVFLLPGEYWIKVSGAPGEYVLSAEATGAPDPGSEREPNNTDDRAQKLAFGQAMAGTVSDSTDRDVFRFSLFAQDHVRLTVASEREGPVGVEIEWGYPSPKRPRGQATERPYVYDALLDPGDYMLRLTSGEAEPLPYRVELERADPFELPDDLEPNDTPAQARRLPDRFEASGAVTSAQDDDWYDLPVPEMATRLRVAATGAVTLTLLDGDRSIRNLSAKAGTFETDVPAGIATRLGVTGDGPYRLAVAFADGPAPRTVPPPPPLTLAVRLDSPSVAAFWIRGQRLGGAIALENTGDRPRIVDLELASSHFDHVPILWERKVTIEAGKAVSVPFSIDVAPDAWANQEVTLAARATTADGGWVSGRASLLADLATAPVAQRTTFPLPPALLGGFNVASAALGGAMTLPDASTGENPSFLQDGLVGDGNVGIFSTDAAKLPYEITVRFGADHPWTIAGITLHPQGTGRIYPAEQLRDFDLELSEDGQSFQPVLSGRLTMLPVEQAFVLNHPRPARAARLRLRSNHADNLGRVGFGEWKVITVPGEPEGLSADLADASRGGHMVWSNVTIGSSDDDQRAMLGAGVSIPVKMPAETAPAWVLGFNENRAAAITALEWQASPLAAGQRSIGPARVEVSRDSPFGPWEVLPVWQTATGTESAARIDLPSPVWARFVRISGTDRPEAETTWALPTALRIFERPVGDGYLSILGEWGQYNRAAIYEAGLPIPPEASSVPDADRGSRAAAETLTPGTPVGGAVKLDIDEDWFVIDIPASANRLTIAATGEPTVDVDIELEDATGSPARLVQLPGSADRLVFEAEVEPGKRYILRVHEPRRSVAVAYDVSPSLSAFAPIIRHAMAAFASGVVPGREFLNFMTFASPFILKDWTDQPWVLEGSILARQDATQLDSSDLWQTLTLLDQALAPRRGVRAAIVVTDAQTPGYEAEASVWEALGKLRPRIFAAHIGAGDDPHREKQIMQDLASVNGGHYASARTQAEMDVVADRAAAWLRRPTRYRLVAAVREEVAPEPGSLKVQMASKAAATVAASAPATVPVAGAIEVILDASGSMLKKLNGERRIESARKVLDGLVRGTLTAGQPMALRVFGDDRPASCETRLAVPLGPLDPEAMAKTIRGIKPVNLARTPIAAALASVASDLEGSAGMRTVVLVTDGEETCDGDPAAEIARLRALGFDVRVNIVGFAVDDPAVKSIFAAWAESGGGGYFDAGDEAELGIALAAAVAPPFEVIDAGGATVARGTIGGAAIQLAAGTYRIRVATDGEPEIADVVVEPGGLKEVDLETE